MHLGTPGIAVVEAAKGVAENLMVSVVIPALNAEATLPQTLTALVPAALEGFVREVVVVDGGSEDKTCEIADHAGA
jgi:glycosyltransferase involved in cell wall biosynthesis